MKHKVITTYLKPFKGNFNSFLFVAAVLLAALLGVPLTQWSPSNTDAGKAFIGTSQFDEWSALVSVLMGLSAAVALFTWRDFRRIAREATNRTAVFQASLMYLLITAAVIFGPLPFEGKNGVFPIQNISIRVTIISLFVLVAGIGSFCGLILLGNIQRERTDNPQSMSAGDTIRELIIARGDLQRFLAGAALLITGAIVVIGSLRSALQAVASIKAYDPNTGLFDYAYNNIATISVGILILYGTFFAALLALVFIPAYFSWKSRSVRLRDSLYPIPNNGHVTTDWIEERSNLENLLEMRQGFIARSLTILGILAPLIGSIISALISTLRG